MEEELREIRILISNNELNSAFELLESIDLGRDEILNAIQTISASFMDLKRRERLNLLSFEDISIQKSKITNSLLELLSSIENSPQKSNNQKRSSKKRLINRGHIEILIKYQKSSIRYFLFYSCSLIAIGIIVIVIGVQFSSETMKTAMNIGGGLISSLSGFPIRELILRKGKIKTFEILAIQLNLSNDTNIYEDDQNRLNDLVWKIIEKTALTI